MSRSVHQTLQSVFEGKSKTEIDRMISEDDPDLLALLEKRGIKQKVKDARQLKSLLSRSLSKA